MWKISQKFKSSSFGKLYAEPLYDFIKFLIFHPFAWQNKKSLMILTTDNYVDHGGTINSIGEHMVLHNCFENTILLYLLSFLTHNL